MTLHFSTGGQSEEKQPLLVLQRDCARKQNVVLQVNVDVQVRLQFLYYEDAGHNWMDEPRNGEGGPNDDMSVFASLGRPVTDTGKMTAMSTYLCIQTQGGVVIPGGKSGVGHLAITEQNQFMPQSFVFNSFASADLGLAQKGAYGHHAFLVVEATGGIGLTQSWYAFPKRSNPHGIYQVFRGSKGAWLEFKIIDIGML